MELKVIGKRLFTERIDKTITEGEYNADVIGITLDRYHDGADLSEYSFRITAYSEDGETMAEQVLSKDPAGERSIRLVWTVSPTFAAESGLLTLTLAGVAPDNSAQIKFTSSPVRINADGRAEFIPEKTVTEQYLNQVQLEVQKAADAARRAEEAASQTFEVPAADEENIGGVLSGGDISVDESGIVTVNSVGGKTVKANVPADAKFTDTVYTLPKASESVLGGVKVDGITVTADENGVISAAAGEKYVLPTATESTLGGVKVDGTTVTVKNGVISAASGEKYVLPAATATVLGGVKVDGTTITAADGVISAVGVSGGGNGGGDYVLPAATDSSLGGVIVDGTTISSDGGVISVEDNSHNHTIGNVAGLQNILDGKADISAIPEIPTIPSSLPANGGNADTVGGFTVGTNVPADAKFTDTVYTLPTASSTVIGGVKADGTTISSNGGTISVVNNSHSHTIANVNGLQAALNGKADISAIPASLPANGGNAATVGGFTVGTNVPANAKFTDTVYTLPKATASVLGGVKVDGTTITADAGGVISALSSGGSGITIDRIFEDNLYWKRANSDADKQTYVKLPHEVTYWDYIFMSGTYCELTKPWFAYPGTLLIKTSDIVYASKDPSTYEATKTWCQYMIGQNTGNGSRIEFRNKTHIKVVYLDTIVIWGIKAPTIASQTMVGTVVANENS